MSTRIFIATPLRSLKSGQKHQHVNVADHNRNINMDISQSLAYNKEQRVRGNRGNSFEIKQGNEIRPD